jgi:hypothetical protein
MIIMKLEFWIVSTIAVLGGAASGIVTHLVVHDRQATVIRASRVELIDRSGKVAAFIGTDRQKDAALVFLDDQQKERAVFGVGPDGGALLVMTGRDGKDRVRILLSSANDDRPRIILGDHERTRLDLGFYPLDSPDPIVESWGLTFYDPHGFDQRLAGFGIHRDYVDKKMEGYAIVYGKGSRVWGVGLK